MATPQLLRFDTFSSAVDIGFWYELAKSKLDTLRLSEEAVPVSGFFAPGSGASNTQSALFNLSLDAFDATFKPPANAFPSHGLLHNKNTLEAFKALDKKALLKEAADKVWDSIVSGAAEKDPTLLNSFVLVTFADLKKYHFYYWFAFPALAPPHEQVFTALPDEQATLSPLFLTTKLKGKTYTLLYHSRDKVEYKECSDPQRAADLVPGTIYTSLSKALKEITKDDYAEATVHSDFSKVYTADGRSFKELLQKAKPIDTVFSSAQAKSFGVEALKYREKGVPAFLVKPNGDHVLTAALSDLSSFFAPEEEKVVAVATPSSCHDSGWPLRNLLVLLKVRFGLNHVRILQYRSDKSTLMDASASDILSVDLLPGFSFTKESMGCAGWERSAGKLVPRFLDLSQTMDPTRLAASAVDLNLKLMRWRLLPNLDLGVVSQSKCLLFGAGTLGCAVARNLTAWGVRKITLVDNGKVSYSNPVRQWLYTFEDSRLGKPKAETAAERLKQIFPDLDAQGISLTIPMPGHIVKGTAAVAECAKAVSTIEQLIVEHDIIFLLLDSREARWLPTLLSTKHRKFTITTALGFDNFVVMRHGVPAEGQKFEDRLGCYFCNDIVAPQDSMTNRTLDQQCTVTRPGLSSLASSMSVELAVSILHHPKRAAARADGRTEMGTETQTELGILPHQIRGFLTYFTHLLITGHHYDKCVGCSDHVVQEYEKKGLDFVISACNNPIVLEDLTGITKMKQESADIKMEWDEASDDDL